MAFDVFGFVLLFVLRFIWFLIFSLSGYIEFYLLNAAMATVIITAAAMNVLFSLIVARDGFFVLLHNLSNESASSSSNSLNSDRRTESSFFVIVGFVCNGFFVNELKIFV